MVWSAIGCVFALQLRWYYELTWSLSIFWGLADWYLWGLLALLIGPSAKWLADREPRLWTRVVIYAACAPVVAALHVVLTMLVAGIGNLPADIPWTEHFQGIYAKKLTLNLLTFAAIVAVYERLAKTPKNRPAPLLAKLGHASRLINPEQIVWGEVSGNYVNLHTRDGVWPVRGSLTEILEKLPAGQFVRISRSAMIRLARVRGTESVDGAMCVLLRDAPPLRVARRYRPLVRRALREFGA